MGKLLCLDCGSEICTIGGDDLGQSGGCVRCHQENCKKGGKLDLLAQGTIKCSCGWEDPCFQTEDQF